MEGPLNDMGACEEEREQRDKILSKKLKLPINKVHSYLGTKTDEKAAELLLAYTGGAYAKALYKSRSIRLERLDSAQSQQEAEHILRGSYPLIDQCRRYWNPAPLVDENGEMIDDKTAF